MLKLFATAWLITWFIIDPQIGYLITAPTIIYLAIPKKWKNN